MIKRIFIALFLYFINSSVFFSLDTAKWASINNETPPENKPAKILQIGGQYDNSVDPSKNQEGVYSLSPYMYLYEEKSIKDKNKDNKDKHNNMGGRLTFKQVKDADFQSNFTLNSSHIPVYPLSDSVVWVRFDLVRKELIQNKSNDVAENAWYLIFNYYNLEQINVYVEKQGGGFREIKAGAALKNNPYAQGHAHIIPIKLKKRTTRIFLRVHSSMIWKELPLYLTNAQSIHKVLSKKSGINTAYFGIVLVLIFYNFFIFILTRDRSYLYYVLYFLCFVASVYSLEGYMSTQLGIEGYKAPILFGNAISIAAFEFVIIFVRKFLNTKLNTPIIDKMLKVNMALGLLVYIGEHISYEVFIQIAYVLITYNIFVILTALIKVYNKIIYARYFLLAWVFFLGSIFIFALREFGIQIPNASALAMQVGNVIEATLMSLALAARISDLEKKNKELSLMQKEMEFAAEVQKHLMPVSLPQTKFFNVAARYLPSSTISGDYYDFSLQDKEGLLFFMADVAGHGYSAGLTASMVKVAYHETLKTNPEIKNHQISVNRILLEHASNTFVTANNLQIDPHKKIISYVRSGHTPLIHYLRKTGDLKEYAPAGLPLGLVEDYACSPMRISYNKGDRLFLYTDGLVEELNEDKEEYGSKMLLSNIRKDVDLSPVAFCDFLEQTVLDWKQNAPTEDDITFAVIDLL